MILFKSLYVFEIEQFTEPLVYLSDFMKLMLENLSSSDKIQWRAHNLQREFNRYKPGIIQLEHGKAVTVIAVLKYIFHHFDDYKVCQDLGLNMEQLIYKSQKVCTTRTTLDLYITLANQRFVAKHLEQYVKLAHIDDRNIPSLDLDHRKDFEADTEGWERICLFENYFSIYFYNKDLVFGETLKTKWNVFERLKSLREASEKMEVITRAVIQNRNQRKGANKETHSIVIEAGQKHRPAVIEKQMLRRLDSIFNGTIDRIACIDTPDSQSNNSIMVCVSIDSIEGVEFNEVALAITNFLQQHHKVNVSCIHFLSSEELKDFQRNHSVKTRVSVRILEQMVNELNIFFSFLPKFDKTLNDGESETCSSCFSDSSAKPLDISTFDLLQEWYLDVPLDMQIVLQTFINPSSLRNASDTTKLLRGKLKHLYITYDSLLHTYKPKKYIGIHQIVKINEADPFSSYFDSVKTVFSPGFASCSGKSNPESSSTVTNSFSGITSLPCAGKSIEENSSAATTSSIEVISSVPFVGASIQERSSTATTSSAEITTYVPFVGGSIQDRSSTETNSSVEDIAALPTVGESSIQVGSLTVKTSSSDLTSSLASAGNIVEERSLTNSSSESTTSLPSTGESVRKNFSTATASLSDITTSLPTDEKERSSAATTCSSGGSTSMQSARDSSIQKRSSAATTSSLVITTSLPSAGDSSIQKRSSDATASLASLPIAGKRNHGGSVDEICYNLFSKKYSMAYELIEGSAKKPRHTLTTHKTSEEKASMSLEDVKPRKRKRAELRPQLPRFNEIQPRCEKEYVSDSVVGIQNHRATSISDLENQNEANSQSPGQPELNCKTDIEIESKFEVDSAKRLQNLQNVKEESCSTHDVVQDTFSEESIVCRGVRSSPHHMFLQKLHNDISIPKNPSFVTQTFKKKPDGQIVTPFTDQNDSLLRQSPFINSEDFSVSRNGNKTSSSDLYPSNGKHRTSPVDIVSNTLSIKTEPEMDVDTISNTQLNLENRNQKTQENGNTFASTIPNRFDPVLDDVAALRSSYSQEQLPCYFEARPINPVTLNSGQCSANVERREMAAHGRPNQIIKCQECVIKHDFIRRSDDGQFSKMCGANMDNIDNKATQHFSSEYLRKLDQYVSGQTGNC